ncbi:ABC transporter substrate-binding protein [Actinacidiphila paucisporea]|uniref:ABC-type nitrate/sulfonate/bicarbonate transport system, substrate-binding protein n=1 Tax=Actinacidiphila paucisporea TaxID=310782 RepID=A0A1M7M2K9_9ACTN|nr:ABC transporter substrate-binding protein [Actinacidiphila paucisporea]SHM84832.1 ABC-type nitrate/sulfonate/bicarbonate transport system, substrate-binding protein [Actinacidiphila paucisporea]
MSVPDEIWFTRCPVPTATGIAADRGSLAAEFAPDGIAVRSLRDAAGQADSDGLPRSHFTHELTALFREGGNVPALWARSRGEATRLIALTWIEERQSILVRQDSDLRTPEQLRGRRLAVPRHDIAIDFWRAMALHGHAGALRLAGLTLDDAELVEIPGVRQGQWEGELAALRDGRVDAVYVKGAVAVETARRYGAKVAVDLDSVPDRRSRINNGTPRPITVHQRLLDEHPDLVVRFLAVLLEAADWAADHPGDVARILGAETGAGPEGVAGAYRDGTAGSLRLHLGQARLDLLAEQERFLFAQGFLPAPVDVAGWADHEPLRLAHELRAARAKEAATAPAAAEAVSPRPAGAPATTP